MTGENLGSTESLDGLSSSPRSSIFLDSYLHHDGEKLVPSRRGDDDDDKTKVEEAGPTGVRLHEFVELIPPLVARYKGLPRRDDGTGPLSKPVLDLLGYVLLSRMLRAGLPIRSRVVKPCFLTCSV
jgi:hypothetical protein